MSTAVAVGKAMEWGEARCRVGIFPIHFARTFSMQALGPYDPTAQRDGDYFRKAFYYRGKVAAVEATST